MDEHELDQQFQKMESDTHVHAVEAAAAAEPPKKKRITVAELNKTTDELTELIDVDIFNWLDKLDTRMRHFENTEAEKPDSTISNITERCKRLEDYIRNLTDREITEIKARIEQVEGTIKTIIGPAHNELHHQLDNQDAAIGALADALRSHIEESAATPQAAETEIEFAKPPQQTAGGQTRKGDIEAVASVCQTMTDVLLICRLLKAPPDMPDEDRTYLLTIACRAAGVPLSAGLQIRAGATSGGV